MIGEKAVVGLGPQETRDIIDVPLTQVAREIGDKIYANSVAVGFVAGALGIERDLLEGVVEQYFSGKTEEIIRHNIEAVARGVGIADECVSSGTITRGNFSIPVKDPKVDDQILCNGAEAVGLGALAGGCNFVSSYPMSPSTGVLVFLAQHAKQFNVIVEQAEDEIAAVNMALGAWYAGGRAFVTTSGGGFALMSEGISLAGAIESPLVVHVAQRPGPATGLPTRTEQGDLELVLYAGHGEFPRVAYAPGTVEDAFYFARRALNIADKCQVPVFILTDQYLMDSYYNCPAFDLEKDGVESTVVRTTKDYKRFSLTQDGISPRGIPGNGDGLVLVDSDEHDEEGRITEDMGVRVSMVDKRLRKREAVMRETHMPELMGPKDYKILMLSWGSTYPIVKEVFDVLERDDVAWLHFIQVFPLPEGMGAYLNRAEKTIVIEGNATSQFGRLIKLETGVEIDEKILKYNGLSFFADELLEKVKSIIGEYQDIASPKMSS